MPETIDWTDMNRLLTDQERLRLESLTSEILKQGASAALPSNLTDHWLERLSDEMEAADRALGGRAACMAIALQLAAAKKLAGADVTLSRLAEYVDLYGVELTLESLRRKGLIDYNQATMDNILTERQLRVRQLATATPLH